MMDSFVPDHGTLETGMVSVMIGGMLMVVTVVVERTTTLVMPLLSVFVYCHISSSVSVLGSTEMVVVVERVHGGRTNVHGGMQAIVGVGSL